MRYDGRINNQICEHIVYARIPMVAIEGSGGVYEKDIRNGVSVLALKLAVLWCQVCVAGFVWMSCPMV
ncbi:MAG: hypothetical protein AAGF06_03385 [Pseudomonadota bacterium]